MRKITFLSILIIAFAFVGNIKADVITIDGANEIANNFFIQTSRDNKITKSVASQLEYAWDSNSLYGNSLLKSSETEPTFYVFSNNGGFVIVAAENSVEQIIGYSFESSMAGVEDIPEPMKDYLLGIDAEIKYARENTTILDKNLKATLAETGGNIVKQIETATWGQGSPFNRQCVTNSGATAKTGCIATAFAIVMKHHGWPSEGTGNLYNSQTGVIISDRTYDWDNMLMSYSGTYTEDQANEVAKIMSHLGHAYMVTYGTSTTSGNTGSSTDKLYKFFGYKNVSATFGSNTTETAWIEMIKESIQNDCPIPYESTNSGTGDSKHIFVLDGYTNNDYFHFNWGWNGYQNGYFKLSAMLPGDGDNYSGLANHKAFFNLMPDRTECIVTASVSPTIAGVVSINGGYAEGSVTHASYENANITLSATAYSGYTFSNWSCNGTIVSEEKSFQTKVSSTDNTFIANFLKVGTTNITIPVTYNNSYGTITYNGSTVSGTSITVKENQEITLTATANSGYTFSGWSITNNGTTKNVATKDITFIATNNTEITATFTLSVADYVVSHATGTKTNASGARSSTWTYTTTETNPVALQLTSTNGSTEVYGLSNSYDRYYAYAYDSNTTGYSTVTYTLSVPEGYVITGYDMTYWVSSSHKGQVTVANDESSNTPTNTNDQYMSASGLSTQSTSFTLTASKAGQQYITIESFTVTIKKEGGDISSIEDNIETPAKIYTSNGVVYINNYTGNIKIVNIAGQIVKDIYCNENAQIEINKGIYLVITSEGVVKVII
ncbi:MAG: C10 family peptidase [Bacteroidales bacterium]|nr:C10 family peptidase [Bacteroidales bacterium]